METEDEKLFQVEDVDNITSYESITVPSTMRSLYWKYFGFPSDHFNNILSRKKVVCILCHSFIAYNKNTTNLRTHLVAKHSDILIQLNEEKKNFNKQKSSTKPPAAARAKRTRKTITKTSSSATSILNSRQELTGIVDYSTLSSITNNEKTVINAIDNNSENNKASTITIIHRSDSDLNNKPKIENICLKLPSNVVSIIESIKSANNSDANFVIEHDVDDAGDDDDNKCLIAPVDEMATDTEFIEETDFQTYSSVILPSTSDDHNFKTEELNINQLENEKYTVLKQSDSKNNNRTDNTASMRDNNNNIANIIEMITKDLLPTNIIEGIGFQNYVSNLNQNYIMPQKTEVDIKIKEIYQNKFSKLKNSLIELCDQHEFSIGLEIFENFEHKTFLNVYFNYYDDNLQPEQQQQQQQQQSQQLQEQEDNTPNLLNVFYKTIELRQSNSCNNNTSELLLKIFDGINMKNCSAAVLNEYNDSLNEFLSQNEIPSIMCFETVMSLCIEKVFKLPEVLKVLTDIENYIDLYSDDNEEFESITFSCKNSWSKLNLLSVFYDNSVWIDDQKFIIKVKIIRNVLLPLKVTLDTLTDEPIAFCSLIKPFTTKLLEDHFSPSENDNDLIMQIKKLISDELKKYIETNSFYSEAAFFDPRFQYFIDPEGIQKVTQNLCDKFKEDIIKENIKYLNDDNPTNKRSSLKQFFNRPERTTNTGKNNFDAELTKYVSEANVDLEQCPLAWWMECGYNYRQLKKISQKYLCVPCCVTNIFRYKISEQIKIMNRRYNLNDKSTINQLWFLHYNKDMP